MTPQDRPTRVLLGAPAPAGTPFAVTVAGSAEELAARLAEDAFDCVVVEFRGAERLRALRRAAPALVVLTAGEDEVHEAIRAGADRCLPASELTGPMLRVAVSEAIERHGDPAPPAREPELLTLQQAAGVLGVSQSRLRRWSDEGRIAAVRTPGGHRRFQSEAVRRLAVELGARPGLQPLPPPAEPLPVLAERLAADGPQLVHTAAVALYRGGPEGWFASPGARGPVAEWTQALRRACASGRYAGALAATDALMRDAYLRGATLLERHCFLDRFAGAAARALTLAGAPHPEQAGARRLFAALQQALLAGEG